MTSNKKQSGKMKKKKKENQNKIFKKIVDKIKSIKSTSGDAFSTKEVVVVMIFSLGIGFLMCFGCINLFTGKNYLKVSKDLDKIVDTYYAIVDNYYGDLDKDSLIEGAIEGMISSVGDTYTSYTNIDDTAIFDETINGKYEGIGCTIATYELGKIVVIEVFEDSPAFIAGLKVGDVIKKVDNISCEDKTSSDISDYIKDSGKEKIVLTVARDNMEMDIKINLSKVEVPYVNGQILEYAGKKVGYMQIIIFSSTAYSQFKNKLEELEKEKIDSLIIDVRDNSGGYLTTVTDILNLLLEKGKVIYQLEDSNGKVEKKDTTREKRNYPLAVLINNASASAFKESYGGLVVGTNSYGKGTVQQTKKLLDGSMIKYTTQKWLTPNGNFIDEVGVTPTNIVELSEAYKTNPSFGNDNQLKEALKLLTE